MQATWMLTMRRRGAGKAALISIVIKRREKLGYGTVFPEQIRSHYEYDTYCY